jgi:hypothetical protein
VAYIYSKCQKRKKNEDRIEIREIRAGENMKACLGGLKRNIEKYHFL